MKKEIIATLTGAIVGTSVTAYFMASKKTKRQAKKIINSAKGLAMDAVNKMN